ncbi:MAG TPA: hypothetical protein VF520_07950 [Thermoleophilaceae bacterium]
MNSRLCFIVFIALALTAPATAHGGTADIDAGSVRVLSGGGESNALVVEQVAGDVQLRDFGSHPLVAGNGCHGEFQINCPWQGMSLLDVRHGDADDSLCLYPSLGLPVRYSGGPGVDEVFYCTTEHPGVVFDNDGVADDGPDRHSNILPDVEVLSGSPGADQIGSGSRGARIRPRDGDDVVRGGPGKDRIIAAYIATDGTEAGFMFDEGNDDIACGGGQDFVLATANDRIAESCEAYARNTPEDPDPYYLFQGSERDDFMGAPPGWSPARMYALGGDDVIQGPQDDDALVVLGPGHDRFRSGGAKNTVRAGSGRDSIDVRDLDTRTSFADVVDCGTGFDRVIADRADRIARNCESVRRLSVPRSR